jgi:hypothetical protein
LVFAFTSGSLFSKSYLPLQLTRELTCCSELALPVAGGEVTELGAKLSNVNASIFKAIDALANPEAAVLRTL